MARQALPRRETGVRAMVVNVNDRISMLVRDYRHSRRACPAAAIHRRDPVTSSPPNPKPVWQRETR